MLIICSPAQIEFPCISSLFFAESPTVLESYFQLYAVMLDRTQRYCLTFYACENASSCLLLVDSCKQLLASPLSWPVMSQFPLHQTIKFLVPRKSAWEPFLFAGQHQRICSGNTLNGPQFGSCSSTSPGGEGVPGNPSEPFHCKKTVVLGQKEICLRVTFSTPNANTVQKWHKNEAGLNHKVLCSASRLVLS